MVNHDDIAKQINLLTDFEVTENDVDAWYEGDNSGDSELVTKAIAQIVDPQDYIKAESLGEQFEYVMYMLELDYASYDPTGRFKLYKVLGKLHNTGGPARIDQENDDNVEYWLNGKQMSHSLWWNTVYRMNSPV